MSNLPIRRGELIPTTGTEGWTVYEPETDSLHVLNDSARAIWELCDGETTSREMAEAISLLTGIDLSEAITDVESTLDELVSTGLVTGWPHKSDQQ